MKNLEQIRARNALQFSKDHVVAGKQGGEVMKKISPLVLNHGLLATCAYSYAENNEGWKKVFDAIAAHLADPEIGILPKDKVTRDGMMQALTGKESNSELLKRATAEAMAWLSYARRFVKKSKDSSED